MNTKREIAPRQLAWAAKREIANAVSLRQAKLAKIDTPRLSQARTFDYVTEQWLQLKAPDLVEESLAGFKGALVNHVYPMDWRFIVGKTRHLRKTKYIVPLPTQAVAILRRMQKARSTG